jgi:RimJ/RimL family protein N-acetyltransferase
MSIVCENRSARHIVTSTQQIIATLAQDPLRNIVLLKHIEAFPDNTRIHHLSDGRRSATLVLLETAASAFDRATYPTTDYAALIASDGPSLTQRLLDVVPNNVGVVFKVAGESDGRAIAARFAVRKTAEFWSFTSGAPFVHDAGVHLTRAPGDAAFDLFATQGHARSWLEPLLDADTAFACIVGPIAQPRAVCFAFENYHHIWEVGGVVAPPEHRGRGVASRAVRTALAELASRCLTPRYQVDRNNLPSIRLAESVGLQRFLVITHFLHLPLADKSAARAQ